MSEMLTSPERPDVVAPIADRAPRFAAHVLDGILTMVVVVGLVLGASVDQEVVATACAVLAGAVWLLYYPVAMQLMGGSTPGKWALGPMYVARADGRPAGFFTGLWRDSVVKLVLSIFVVIDGLFVLLGKERRALHDFAAGTTVRMGRPNR